ncbi:hypothetical protein HYW76_00860 [Candidatus Pacearchaeota archaeon]|nr:hypothetical protein [Candidatus Pacearchaeota archaeon]
MNLNPIKSKVYKIENNPNNNKIQQKQTSVKMIELTIYDLFVRQEIKVLCSEKRLSSGKRLFTAEVDGTIMRNPDLNLLINRLEIYVIAKRYAERAAYSNGNGRKREGLTVF